MGPDLTPIDVFVASPGDCAKERATVGKVVEEINRTVGEREGWFCRVSKWEQNARPAVGRGQQLILDQIGPYDIMVGIMYKRFGTPTGKAGSGTEEEYDAAFSQWRRKRKHKPEIMFYFREVSLREPNKEEIRQYELVTAFRKKVYKATLAWHYKYQKDFADRLRPHLIDAAHKAYAKRKASGVVSKGTKTKTPKKKAPASAKTRTPKKVEKAPVRSKSPTISKVPKPKIQRASPKTKTVSVPKVQRSYTEGEKQRYIGTAYNYVCKFIKQHAAEMHKKNRGVKVSSKKGDEGELIVSVETGGNLVGGLKVSVEKQGYSPSINYSTGVNAMSGYGWGLKRVSLEENKGELGFQIGSHWNAELVKQGKLAQSIWDEFCTSLKTQF